MIDSHVEAMIKQAAAAAGDDPQIAVRKLLGLCERDDRLLRALVSPYLQGILFHHVERVMKTIPRAERRTRSDELPPEALDAIIERLGDSIPTARPRTISGPPRNTDEAMSKLGIGLETPTPPPATPKHQAAMRTLAEGFKWQQRDK